MATCLEKTKTNEKEKLAALNMMKAKEADHQTNLKASFRDRLQKSESKTQMVRELQSQVDVKKNRAKEEADREKEAFEINKKMD